MTITTDLLPGTDYDWLPSGFGVHEVHANGIRLSAAVGGQGPTMVLLHGWPQTSRAWRLVMPELAQRYTVVVPDLRGAGASEMATDGYLKTNQAEDLRQLLAGLELEGPSVVVGHDIGAMIAFAWAAKHPDDVAAVALLDVLLPGFGLEEAMDVTHGGMWHFGFFAAPWPIPEMLFDGHELEFFSSSFRAISNPDTFSDDDLEFYTRAYLGRERLRGGFEQYRTLLDDGRENRELLRRPLQTPLLVIGGGARTGSNAADALRDHAEQLTGAVAPTGHFIAEEDPTWLLLELERFLSPK